MVELRSLLCVKGKGKHGVYGRLSDGFRFVGTATTLLSHDRDRLTLPRVCSAVSK
jgi:hypothetical protein